MHENLDLLGASIVLSLEVSFVKGLCYPKWFLYPKTEVKSSPGQHFWKWKYFSDS